MCWRQIAAELGTGRTSKQCREHYLNSLRPDMKKGGWTQREEVRLGCRGCVGVGGAGRTLAAHASHAVRPERNAQYIIAREHSRTGSHWSTIAKKLPGRTDNSIKNLYNATWRSKANNKVESFLVSAYDSLIDPQPAHLQRGLEQGREGELGRAPAQHAAPLLLFVVTAPRSGSTWTACATAWTPRRRSPPPPTFGRATPRRSWCRR